MRTATVCLVLGLLSSTAFSQELTTAQVLARMDEKAKAFTSLEASISQAQGRCGFQTSCRVRENFHENDQV